MKARLFAHYLPQFHPIPENDLWWGRGFTEWTNTAKAKPLFPGHILPNVPADLGYYDLRVAESREAQAELAKEYGIEGFCYWHYWFGGGKRLLERPFNEVLKSGKPDFPFCLAWANHTWSGIWHGCPDRVLIEQSYPGVNDYKSHFYSVLDAFTDKRYLKINNRNIFCIYRPYELKDSRVFMGTWRELAKREGAPDFYFVGITDYPWSIMEGGYNAFTTNPPFSQLVYSFAECINEQVEKEILAANPHITVSPALPRIYTYENFIKNAFPKATRRREFFPCVMPNWDNTPRSGRHGLVLQGSNPELYRQHLNEAISLVENNPTEEKVIFVKSWNEWAEGNYLEPDVVWGRAYLETTLSTIKT
jgi:hypothetical protein